MELFTQEVKDMKGLKEVLKDNNKYQKIMKSQLLYMLSTKRIK